MKNEKQVSPAGIFPSAACDARLRLPGVVYRVLIQRNCTVEVAGDSLELLTGYTLDGLSHGTLCALDAWMHPAEKPDVVAAIEDALKTGNPFDVQYRVKCKNGETKVLMERGQPGFDSAGKPLVIDGVIVDITELDRNVSIARQRELALRAAIRALGVGVVLVHKPTHMIMGANAVAQKLTGLFEHEMLGRTCYETFCAAEEGKCPVTDLGQKMTEVDAEIRAADGTWIPVSTTETEVSWGGEAYIVVSFRDVRPDRETERQNEELETRLLRAEKLETLGIIASGVAHNLNNIMGPLVALPDLLDEEIEEVWAGSHAALHSAKKNLAWIRTAGERAAAMIADLVIMGKCGNVARHEINMNELVRDLLDSEEIIELRKAHPLISLEVEVKAEQLLLTGSPSHLARALTNLLRNAFESIEGVGAVKIIAAETVLTYPRAGYEIIEPGRYALLIVNDTGEGMDERSQSHMFEPFYTTRRVPESGASGLGLAMVRGIVKDHGGFIHVTSKRGAGTGINLYLPLVEKTAEKEKEPVATVPGPTGVVDIWPKVLVVDDDPDQLDLIQSNLTIYQYTAVRAPSGRHAVELFEQARQKGEESPFDVVLLDMVMEDDFDGLDTLERILEMYPSQKVVMVSGYDPGERGHKAQGLGAGWLSKPYSFGDVDAAIKEQLNRS